MENVIHRFEAAGLGIAPFTVHLVIMGEWSNCEYCGTNIKEHCYIKDSLGKIFLVGNECVKHTSDEGLIDETKKLVNELRRKIRHEKEAQKIEEGRLLLFYSEKLRTAYSTGAKRRLVEPYLTQFIENRMSHGGNTYKLELVKRAWEVADEVLTKDEIADFLNRKDELREQIEEQKRLKKLAEEAEMERRRAEFALKQQQIAIDNADIIKILEKMNQTPFVVSMIDQLKYKELKYFSVRQQEVLTDIYADNYAKAGFESRIDALKAFNARTERKLLA